MQQRVQHLRSEYQDLRHSMQDEAVFSNPKELARIGKRLSQLEPLMKLLDDYDTCQSIIDAVEDIQDDPELLAMAKDEAQIAKGKIAELEENMKAFLVPRDPMDDRNVVLEVRAGTGGEEAALFAAQLMRMYIRFAEEKGWLVQLLDKADADAGGIKEAVIRIEGPEAYGHLKFEGGVHRVQRIPETENKGRVHTSAATVAVLPEAEEQDVTIRNEDLRVDTYRAGGAGGQHVNKTESAVRITHMPTGVIVACQSERSQLKNRARAMELLRTRLYAAEQERQAKEHGDMRSKQVGSGDRSEKIRTYNFPQDRLTDHRIGENFHNLPAIMEGDFGDVVDSIRKKDLEMRLSQAV